MPEVGGCTSFFRGEHLFQICGTPTMQDFKNSDIIRINDQALKGVGTYEPQIQGGYG